VYVKSGSLVPWADLGQHTGTPETRRITMRVYGDGSIPFVLAGGKGSVRLSWSGGKGSVDGESVYDVYGWQQIG
jgi:alpha-D-xyloside xylohydrolase